jgi:hypothetical protein
MNYQPYTYLIRFIPTGQLYYGCSYANNKNRISHPSQLWNSYFTSSEIIKKLINEYGVDSFEVVSSKNHKDKETTLLWEHRFLRRVDAKNNSRFLNQHNGAKDFKGGPHTEETKKKLSKPKSEEAKQKMRKPKSDSHKQNIKNGLSGLPKSKEHCNKISISMKGIPRLPFTDEHKRNMSKPKNRVSRLIDKKEMTVRLFTMWVNSLPT